MIRYEKPKKKTKTILTIFQWYLKVWSVKKKFKMTTQPYSLGIKLLEFNCNPYFYF